MSSYAQALDIVARLEAAGIAATCDPRGATPPCVLIAPPAATVTMDAATGQWSAWALSPTTANLDAWKALDELVAAVWSVLPIEGWDFLPYTQSADSPAIPAYRIRFTEAFDI